MSLIKTELFACYAIEHNEDYRLEANIDYNKNNRFYMPTLTFEQTIKYLVQYTSNDAELGAKIRMLINNTYGK